MKIVNMSVSNYRQFKHAELNFDDGITVLAGANNSGKTSLITLIKNVFTKEKMEYSESDIPAVNMQNWINTVYPSKQMIRMLKVDEKWMAQSVVMCIVIMQ